MNMTMHNANNRNPTESGFVEFTHLLIQHCSSNLLPGKGNLF